MGKTQVKARPLRPAAPQPTEEEIRQAAERAMAQQQRAMAQTFAVNIVHATPFDVLKEHGAQEIADFSNELSKALMESWYKPKEDEEAAE